MKYPLILASVGLIALAAPAMGQGQTMPDTPATGPTDTAVSPAGSATPDTADPAAGAATGPTTPDNSGSSVSSGATSAPGSTVDSSTSTSTSTSTAQPSTGSAGMTTAGEGAATPSTGATASGTDMGSSGATVGGSATGTAGAGATGTTDMAKSQAAEQVIAQNWSKYDTEGKGMLNPLQFGTWVMAAQGQDLTAQVNKSKTGRQANLPATRVLNATAGEFSKADKNGDRSVSREELRDYLSA